MFRGFGGLPPPQRVCIPRSGRTRHPSVPEPQPAGAGGPWVPFPPRGTLSSCLTFTGGSEEVAAS